eukprot:SAG31_NODE_939_length_10873_cov_5.403843_6_plen_75_part_00
MTHATMCLAYSCTASHDNAVLLKLRTGGQVARRSSPRPSTRDIIVDNIITFASRTTGAAQESPLAYGRDCTETA